MNARIHNSVLCPRCKSADSKVITYADTLDFRGVALDVRGLTATSCLSCGLSRETDDQEKKNLQTIRAAFLIRRDEVRHELGLLSGEQIGAALKHLGLSRQDAAKLFGGGPHAFSKYMTGEVLQSVAMDRLIRASYYFGEECVQFLKRCEKDLAARPAVITGGAVFNVGFAGAPNGVRVKVTQGPTGPATLMEMQFPLPAGHES